MATAIAGYRIITATRRLELRESFGDLSSMFNLGLQEQAEGHLLNARAAYRDVLAEWLHRQWLKSSGSKKRIVIQPALLNKRLRCSGVIDVWTSKLISSAVTSPKEVNWLHVDLLAGVVSAVCFGSPTISKRAGASCQS